MKSAKIRLPPPSPPSYYYLLLFFVTLFHLRSPHWARLLECLFKASDKQTRTRQRGVDGSTKYEKMVRVSS